VKPDRRAVLGGLLATVAAGGCGLLRSGPLSEPPAGFDRAAWRPPVVFVHGTFGSRLRNRASGREIWPVGTPELLFSDYAELELPLDPATGEDLPDAVVATAVFEEAGSLDFYGSLIEALSRAGGYRRELPGNSVDDTQPRQYAYLYDWRRDLADSARGLDAFIEQIRRDHADPGLRVDLVVHSSGGLLARYFLLYGDRPLAAAGPLEPTLAGVPKVRRVVAIGVPEIGLAHAVQSLSVGESIGLNRIWPSTLATSHAPFQLLPQGDDAWLLGGDGRPFLQADAFDPGFWREQQLSVFDPLVRDHARHQRGRGPAGRAHLAALERAFEVRLARARRFRDALRAAPLSRELPYFVLAGNCRATLARLVLERRGERAHLRSTPGDVRWPQRGVPYPRLMLEPGDGIVTAASARARPRMPPPGAPRTPAVISPRWERLVCASHNQLVVNVETQRALLLALGS
jgi:hypothetical protein